MVLLSLSFDSLHGILRRLYDEMTELCQPMMTLATAIAALGALFYIAYRVWQSLSRRAGGRVQHAAPLLSGHLHPVLRRDRAGKPERYPEPRRAGNGCHAPRPDLRREEVPGGKGQAALRDAPEGGRDRGVQPHGRGAGEGDCRHGLERGGLRGDAADVPHLLLLFPAKHRTDHHAQGDGVPFPRRLAGGGHDPYLLSHRPLRAGAYSLRDLGLRRFPGHARTVAGPLYQRISLAAHLRPARGDARQDTDAGVAKRDGNDTGSPERLLPGRIDGHLSGVHAHRAGGIFLRSYRGELGGPGRRHGGVQPEHEQYGEQGRQRGRGRGGGIHGQRGRSTAEKVKTTE